MEKQKAEELLRRKEIELFDLETRVDRINKLADLVQQIMVSVDLIVALPELKRTLEDALKDREHAWSMAEALPWPATQSKAVQFRAEARTLQAILGLVRVREEEADRVRNEVANQRKLKEFLGPLV